MVDTDGSYQLNVFKDDKEMEELTQYYDPEGNLLKNYLLELDLTTPSGDSVAD